jgi:uncharacterized damage-inducible protein DinB
VQRMLGRDVPSYENWPIKDENPPPFEVLEAKWNEQAQQTLAALSDVRNWSDDLEYSFTEDDGRQIIVNASPADIFTQLALHEVHHRAQALNILRRLGITIAEDLDYNALMYKRREAAAQARPTAPTGDATFS